MKKERKNSKRVVGEIAREETLSAVRRGETSRGKPGRGEPRRSKTRRSRALPSKEVGLSLTSYRRP